MIPKKQIQGVILIALLIIGVLAIVESLTPMAITLPEGHRAYEWEWKAKYVHASIGTRKEKIKEAVKDEIVKALFDELDEKGNPIALVAKPEITHMKVVKSYTVYGNVIAYDYEITAVTKFHGSFTEGSVSLAVLAILYKVLPVIIIGILAILVLDRIITLAEVVRDITTDYVTETTYAVDEEGNLVLDDEGNPIVIGTKTYRKSRVGEWMPWVFATVAIIAGAIILAKVWPLFGRRKR